jgi:hypothetical protein
MKPANLSTAAAIAAMLVIAAPLAAAAQPDAGREARDRAEIEALMWNYNRALDSLNADAYVAVYTPDGAFGATKGHDALYKMVADLKKANADREAKGEKPGAMFHMETNQHLEFVDRDHARLQYYWQTAFAAPAPGQPARIAAVGRGVDDLVRVKGKWLIQNRNVAPKD